MLPDLNSEARENEEATGPQWRYAGRFQQYNNGSTQASSTAMVQERLKLTKGDNALIQWSNLFELIVS